MSRYRQQGENRPRLTRPREGDTKRRRVEDHLATLTPDQLGVATASSIVAALAELGISISERFASRILEEWRWDHRPPRKTRRR